MRHAKSSWEHAAASDVERPLNERGRRDAPRVGAWLARHALVPDLCVSSPARRARETTELVVRTLHLDPASITWEPDLYGADLECLTRIIAHLPAQAQRVLLVAHNPGLEQLVPYLAADSLPAAVTDKVMPTGALYCLECPGSWAQIGAGCARVTAWVQPRRLDRDP